MSAQSKARNQFENTRKRDQGFVLVAMMIAMPLVITALICLAGLAKLTRNETRAHSLCEKRAMITQSNLAPSLDALLKLNAPAKAVRIEINELELALDMAEATQQWEIVPELEAQITAAKAEQTAIDVEQKSIITLANQRVRLDGYEWQRSLHDMSPAVTTQSLQVKPSTEGVTAPEYEIVSDFSSAQAMRAKYQISAEDMFGGPLIELFRRIDRPMLGVFSMKCAATLEQRGNRFHARLWQ